MRKKNIYERLAGFVGRAARISSRRLNVALAIFSAFFVVLACLVYIWAQKKAENALVEQTLHREQIIARAGAKSIESFFELLGAQVATFSTRNTIVTQDLKNSQIALDLFMDKWRDMPVGGIVLVGKDGEVLVNANRLKLSDVRTDVSGGDYFAWAKTAKVGEVFISKSFVSGLGSSKGKYIVVVAAPIVADGEFRGVLAASVILSGLTDTYLTPLKISEKTQVHLVNQEGTLLSTTIGQLTGKELTKYLEENPFPGSDILVGTLKKELVITFERGEGKLNYIRNSLEDKKTLKRWLLAYSVVNLGEKGLEQPADVSPKRWLLAVETPIEDVELFFGPFAITFTTALIVAILIVISFSTLLILIVRVAQKDAYMRGFIDGRDHNVDQDQKEK